LAVGSQDSRFRLAAHLSSLSFSLRTIFAARSRNKDYIRLPRKAPIKCADGQGCTLLRNLQQQLIGKVGGSVGVLVDGPRNQSGLLDPDTIDPNQAPQLGSDALATELGAMRQDPDGFDEHYDG
jgi:hypothetical protein